MTRKRIQVRCFYHKAEHRTTRRLEVFALGRGEHVVEVRNLHHYNSTERLILNWKFGTKRLALATADRVVAQWLGVGYKELYF